MFGRFEITFLAVFVTVTGILGSIVNGAIRRTNGTKAIERWALENQYEVLDAAEWNLPAGPFFRRKGPGQTIFRISVQDSEGRVHSGLILCGPYLRGLKSKTPTVAWDQELTKS
ncbi:MAG: hypothetical protein JWM57_350 [Phycisphaerales bacterium]|nr:hypothetical protein [Phycisphaerales bacterium]